MQVEAKGYTSQGPDLAVLPVEPGTLGLRFVLERAQQTTFRAVDAKTCAPIEVFGLRVVSGIGSESKGRRYISERALPAPRRQAGGALEVSATPGVDVFTMTAADYRTVRADVQWDQASPGVQTVQLKCGGSLVGRLDAEGLEGWSLLLEMGAWSGGGRQAPGQAFGVAPAQRPSGAANQELAKTPMSRRTRDTEGRDVPLRVDGSFEVRGLDSGRYRLMGRSGSGRVLVVEDIRVRHSSATDLGVLTPTEAGHVRGRVLIEPEFDPSGIEVFLDDWRHARVSLTDAEGRFEFSDVEPGTHYVISGTRARALAGGRPLYFELAASQVAELELDARGLATGRLTVRVLGGGEPLERVRVSARFESSVPNGWIGRDLGITNALGAVQAEFIGGTSVALEVTSGAVAWTPDVGRIVVPAAGDVEVEIELDLGSAELRLPEGLDMERSWHHTFELFAANLPGSDPISKTSWVTESGSLLFERSYVRLLTDPPRLLLEGVPTSARSYRCTTRERSGRPRGVWHSLPAPHS